jgi:hypothetical protein
LSFLGGQAWVVDNTRMGEIIENNWPSAIMDRLWTMYQDEEECDFTVLLYDNKSIKCHSAVLKATTSYFHHSLSPFKVPDVINVRFVKAIIRYMYTGQLLFDLADLEGIAKAARIFELHFLEAKVRALKVKSEMDGIKDEPIFDDIADSSCDVNMFQHFLDLPDPTQFLESMTSNRYVSIATLSTLNTELRGR